MAHPTDHDPASSKSPGMITAQEKHKHAGDEQLAGSEHETLDLILKSDFHDSHPDPCLQGESANPAITPASCSTAQFSPTKNRESANLGSLASTEMAPVEKQVTVLNKEDPTSSPDRGVDCPEPCLQGASTETAATAVTAAFSCPAPNAKNIAHSASFTSPETDPVQKANPTGHNETTTELERSGAPPEPPRNIPRVEAPLARHSRAAKSPTISAGHRGVHIVRMPRKSGNRALQNFRALQHHRTLRSPFVNPAGLPVEAPAVDTRRNRDIAKTPNPPRSTAKAKGGNQAPHHLRAPQAPQVNIGVKAADRRGRIPIIDMEGIPHVVGGLVEASLGRKDILFAQQVQGDPSDPYNSLKVNRHGFFPFPAPDIRESNEEFDRELEEYRPIFEGFDLDLIDQQLDSYAEGTKLLVEVMDEHQAEFDPVNDLFSSNKKELTHLNYERQRAITSEYAIKPVMTPKERSKRLAEIAAAEAPLMKEQEHVQRELKEIILRGRAKIARGLRQDLRVATVIDERRTRAQQRKMIEEQDTELGIAGAMIGLRGSLKEQDHPTHTAILRFTQLVVDKRLKAFDEADKPRKPDKSNPVRLTSNVEDVIHTVPDWFTILDAKRTVELYGATPLDRFKELLGVMGNSTIAAREEQWANESRPNRNTWNKQYHEPHDAWPNAMQRSRGGWWTCRAGLDASPAERNCQLCHPKGPTAPRRSPIPSAADQYQHVLDEVETAMAEANKRDRFMLKYQLQQEREDINRYWQQREWSRSGGGVDVSEVLHSRDVNGLNYRPSAGRPQSSQDQNAATQ